MFFCVVILGYSVGVADGDPTGDRDSSGVPAFAYDYLFGPLEVPECGETDDLLEQIEILRRHMNDPENFYGSGRGQFFADENGREISYLSVSRLFKNLRLKNPEDLKAVLPFVLDPDPKIRLLVGSACKNYPEYEGLYGMGYWTVLVEGGPEDRQAIIDSFAGLIAKERED